MNAELAGSKKRIHVTVIVAHPDDETLWAGGTILMHPHWQWYVVTVCRADDPDRATRFFKVLECLGASGKMADLDDGPQQRPLPDKEVEQVLLSLIGGAHYDLILTHSPNGEYTRHLRHEEVSRAVTTLWEARNISADEVWMFAYEDGGGQYLPRAIQTADYRWRLPRHIWQEKHDIIEKVYGFAPQSLEARTVPQEEAFWCLTSSEEVGKRWGKGVLNL